ncbi:MAG: RNA polymerase sigma factor [Myxococcota bacterium]
MASRDDELTALALRASEGDEEAFEVLVARTRPALTRAAVGLVGAAGEDAVQETYIRAYVALLEGRFRAGRGVQPWLRRIVTRVAIDLLRAESRRRRREALVARLPWVRAELPRTGEVRTALERLPAGQRAAVVLKDVVGWTAKEISLALDCSEGAVEQRLVRGRAALRKELGDDE